MHLDVSIIRGVFCYDVYAEQHELQVAADNGIFCSIDAKTRRNSTDMEDIFIAHIAGMDTFARAYEITLDLLNNSSYRQMRSDRYASFDPGKGAQFEKGELSLEQLSKLAKINNEPKQFCGKQELYQTIINQLIN